MRKLLLLLMLMVAMVSYASTVDYNVRYCKFLMLL